MTILNAQLDAEGYQCIKRSEHKTARNNEQYTGTGSSCKFVPAAFWRVLIIVHQCLRKIKGRR
jgi:hypothetical protein